MARDPIPHEQKNSYSKLAAFMPPMLLVVTFVVAFVARSARSTAPPDSAAPSVVNLGWLVISALIPWILLVFLLLGAGILIVGMLRLTGWLTRSQRPAPRRPRSRRWKRWPASASSPNTSR